MNAVAAALFVALVTVATGLPTGAFTARQWYPAASEEQDPDWCYICRCKCGSKAHR